MGSNDLTDYIEAGLTEGQLDSHGCFTLALTELLRKLGNHGLYHWGNWSLFLVRGLVRLGCHSLHLKQKGKQLWLVGHGLEAQHLWTEMQALSPDQVLAAQSAGALIARALGSLISEHVELASLFEWRDSGLHELMHLTGECATPKLSPIVQKQGWSLGLFVQLRTQLDLSQHLAYAVQYCPRPFLAHRSGWFDSDSEVRGRHWLDQDSKSEAYPPDQLARVKIPLCCDVYQAAPQGGLLLKPCGAKMHAQRAFWCERSNLDWLQRVGATGSISSLGRYFWGETTELQELTFSGTRKFMNSSWGEKGPSQGKMTTSTGRHILHIAFEDEPDQVVPVMDGVALGVLRGKLGIPGLTLIVEAPQLALDLSGLQLVQSPELEHWLQSLRALIRSILEEVTEVPPETSVVLKQPPLGKVMLATGGACFVAGALTFGLNPADVICFTHGGIFGGTAVAGALRVMNKHLPRQWQEQERELVISTLKKRLRDTRKALRQRENGVHGEQLP
ncbi:hypothetical protein JST97_35950 [bacterium]|nr:hypothetical protein [bacterium]